MKKIVITALLLLSTIYSNAEFQKFNTILYGVAYYNEYMPYERMDKDIEMMKTAGINVIRVGESTWSLYEPQEGKFEFEWLDKVIDKFHKAGIKVILGTPTYSIPAWMALRHPNLFVDKLDGGKASFGIRQNFDITNPTYLFYSERIIRKMMEHYAKHPAIIGFQVDNETTTYGAANFNFFRGFVNYMKDKYKTTENLNKLWGLSYWGMTLNDWDEFPTRHSATHPSYKLEWDRYGQKAVGDFLTWQAKIVSEYKRPDQFVTHDFMTLVEKVHAPEATRSLDVISLNAYHGTQHNAKGEGVTWSGDFYRSVKKTNYMITETNAQAMGWTSKTQYPPFDGQPRLFAYSHFANGANMLQYWHWHSLHYGLETYWKGVLGHDLEPNRFYNEVSQVGNELKKIGTKLVNLKIKNKVGILYSRDSNFGLGYMQINNNNAYTDVMKQMHRAAYRNNIGVDFVFAEEADFTDYQLLFVPPLYVADDVVLKKISNFVKNGGHVIMSVKSGYCDENNVVRAMKAPGVLREAAGFYYQEYSTIKTLSLKDDPFKVGTAQNEANTWVEFIIPETAKALATYNDPFFAKYPAVTENKFGKGSFIYEGCLVSDSIQSVIFENKAVEIGLIDKTKQLKYPIAMKTGTNDFGKTIRYYLNYSDQEQTVTHFFKAGTNLFTSKAVKTGDKLILKPWDVLIVEE